MTLFHFCQVSRKAGDIGTGYRRDTHGHHKANLEFPRLLMFDALTCRPRILFSLVVSVVTTTPSLLYIFALLSLLSTYAMFVPPHIMRAFLHLQQILVLSQKNSLQRSCTTPGTIGRYVSLFTPSRLRVVTHTF